MRSGAVGTKKAKPPKKTESGLALADPAGDSARPGDGCNAKLSVSGRGRRKADGLLRAARVPAPDGPEAVRGGAAHAGAGRAAATV